MPSTPCGPPVPVVRNGEVEGSSAMTCAVTPACFRAFETPTSMPAVPTAMYPVPGNGTNPYPAGPTGFKTSTKPAMPTGTGAVPTSVLPSFSFVSEVATPTGETAIPSSTVPAGAESSAAYPVGGGYGGASSAPASSKTPEAAVSSSTEAYTPPAATPDNSYGSGSGYGSGYGTY